MEKAVNLRLNLDNLTKKLSHLSEELSIANEALQGFSIPPSTELGEQICICRREFEELRNSVLESAKSLQVSTPPANKIISVKNLETLLQAVAEAEKGIEDAVRQQALDVLERILLIRYSENNDFPALQQCQIQANELQRAISNWQDIKLHPEVQALASGEHPLAKLLTLISARESPDYLRLAEELEPAITQSFGMLITLAASAGKLVLLSESELVPVESEVDNANEITFSIENVESENSTSVEPSAIETNVQDTTRAEIFSSTERPEIVKELVIQQQTLPSIISVADALAREQTGVQEIAASILNSNGKENHTAIEYLMYQLLKEEKYSLAFHLARYIEIRFSNLQTPLPSWIIRAVILGHHVRYEVGFGEIANILMDDFSNFSESLFEHKENEYIQATSLFLVASTLRPALLAPNTNASEILNHLQLGEGLNRLFEYCRVIGNYGSQRCALNTTAIKTVRSQEEWEADIAALCQEVETWRLQAPNFNLIYGIAKAVWREWLKPNNLIYSLLIYIKENDINKLVLLKKYVERLSSESQINAEVMRTQKDINGLTGGNAITGKPLYLIRQRVGEAVNFARRWIELQEYRSDKENDFSQRQAKQLKQELYSHHNAVLKELESFVQGHPSILVKAGIYCCKKAVVDIRTLFEPNAPLPIRESEPKHLLYADILRIPAFPLGDNWQPDLSDHNLLFNGILELIANARFDWGKHLRRRVKAAITRRQHELLSTFVLTRKLQFL